MLVTEALFVNNLGSLGLWQLILYPEVVGSYFFLNGAFSLKPTMLNDT